MDVPRKRDRRFRSWIWAGLGLIPIAGGFVVLSGLPEGAAEIDRDVAWIGTVALEPMAIEIQAPGRLKPEDERWITAPSDGVVETILIEPGDAVTGSLPLIRLTNRQLRRETLDAELTVRSERATAAAERSRLDNQILDLEASVATLRANLKTARLKVDTNDKLAEDGLVPPFEAEVDRVRAEELTERLRIELERLERRRSTLSTELSAWQARIDKAESMLAYLRRELGALEVRTRVPGIVTEIVTEAGSRVSRGDRLVRLIDPDRLIAELDVPQVRARDVAVGQPVTVDTRNTRVAGAVRRIDPSVQEGVVRVDVELTGPLPDDARAELRVDGRIRIADLGEVLQVRRPLEAREGAEMDLFRLIDGGPVAERVRVRLGRVSVNTVQIVEGLAPGDRVILSDTSQFEDASRLRLR